MSIRTEIVCDGCGFVHRYGRSQGVDRKHAHQMRTELHEKLRWDTERPGGEDLCYHCAEKRKKARSG